MWSIPGKCEEEWTKGTVDFIQDVLLVPEEEKIGDRINTVRRTRSTYRSKIKDEVLAVFDSSSSRDFIFSHSKNLAAANSGPERGIGMRLDYPAHLGSNYRALDQYGASLRKKVGAGFRRNIKFNDDEYDLYMDINFPANKDRWIRVTPRMAKESRGTSNVESEAEAKDLIKQSLHGTGAGILTGANTTPLTPDEVREMDE